VTIGPVIENGFYYDFSYKRPFTPEDLAAIEAKMTELARKDETGGAPRAAARRGRGLLQGLGEHYKAEIIASIPGRQDVSLYREGSSRTCAAARTCQHRQAQALQADEGGRRLLARRPPQRDAAAHLRHRLGQQGRPAAYLHMLEEAEKRDHRKLGRELDLFHIDEHAPGTGVLAPQGLGTVAAGRAVHAPVYRDNGYQEVKGPQILDKGLWEKTGHWDKYRENMFTTESEKRDYALKPMNCPGHILIFKQGIKSYRDLPLRYGEFGQCHRNEPTGGLHGIMRVRGFTQDDGHIFCTEDQIQAECVAFTTLLQKVYADFGFTDIIYKVATRPEKRIGHRRELGQGRACADGISAALGCEFDVARRRRLLRPEDRIHAQGRARPPVAVRHDAGRLQHCRAAGREFVGEERPHRPGDAAPGHRRQPRALHRHPDRAACRRAAGVAGAGAGGGANITDAQADYAAEVAKSLQKQGVRVQADLRNEKITYKIREHSLQKVPYILVVGDKEKANGAVAVRARGNQDLGVMPLVDFIAKLEPTTSPARFEQSVGAPGRPARPLGILPWGR
jgi:threonyl-tRNA synthetase